MIKTKNYDGVLNLSNQEVITEHDKKVDFVADCLIDYYHYDGSKSIFSKNKVKEVMAFMHFDIPNEFDELTEFFNDMIRHGGDKDLFHAKLNSIANTVAKCLKDGK